MLYVMSLPRLSFQRNSKPLFWKGVVLQQQFRPEHGSRYAKESDIKKSPFRFDDIETHFGKEFILF